MYNNRFYIYLNKAFIKNNPNTEGRVNAFILLLYPFFLKKVICVFFKFPFYLNTIIHKSKDINTIPLNLRYVRIPDLLHEKWN